MGRLLGLRLSEMRKVKAEYAAKKLDISVGTWRSLLDDTWSSIDRKVLERLLDLFKCQPDELFYTQESPFFDPIRGVEQHKGAPRCHLVIPVDPNLHRFADHAAVEIVEEFLKDSVPDLVITTAQVTDALSFETLLEDGSCIVFGSPSVNTAAEIALRRAFGVVAPENASATSIPIPFIFVDKRVERRSSLTSNETFSGHEYGIFSVAEDLMVKSEVRPPKHLQDVELNDSPDAGLLLVQNLCLPSGAARKVIVLAGITRIGTLGAAHALLADYRDLEPVSNETLAWGIVEARSDKPLNTTVREYRSVRWALRSGGRDPLKPLKKKPNSSGASGFKRGEERKA